MDGVDMNEKAYRDLITKMVSNDANAYYHMRDTCNEYLSSKNGFTALERALFEKAYEMGYLAAKYGNQPSK